MPSSACAGVRHCGQQQQGKGCGQEPAPAAHAWSLVVAPNSSALPLTRSRNQGPRSPPFEPLKQPKSSRSAEPHARSFGTTRARKGRAAYQSPAPRRVTPRGFRGTPLSAPAIEWLSSSSPLHLANLLRVYAECLAERLGVRPKEIRDHRPDSRLSFEAGVVGEGKGNLEDGAPALRPRWRRGRVADPERAAAPRRRGSP